MTYILCIIQRVYVAFFIVEAEDILRITGEEDLVAGKYYSDNNYDRLFKIDTYYFLASSYPGNDYALWCIGPNGYVYYGSLRTSGGELGVRPVVSLKSEVRTEGVDENGSWWLEKRKSRGMIYTSLLE